MPSLIEIMNVDGEWQRPSDVVLGHEGSAVVEQLPTLRPDEARWAMERLVEAGGAGDAARDCVR